MKSVAKKYFWAVALIVVAGLFVVSLSGCGSSPEVKQNESNSEIINLDYLDGATAAGLAYLDETESTLVNGVYNCSRVSTADAVLADLTSGKCDIACIPINVAANYYNKTDGSISILDICVKCPLKFMSADTSIEDFSQLRGRTIYSVGKGSVPNAVLEVLLNKAGISLNEVNIEYKSDPVEIAGFLQQNTNSVGFIYEPAATLINDAHEQINEIFSANKLWEKYVGGQIVTAVAVVRNDYLKSHPRSVAKFMSDHKKSINKVLDEPDWAYEVSNPNAILNADICFIKGEYMADTCDTFLKTIKEFSSTEVLSEVPDSSFYITGKVIE